jgi:hypothetical protein
MLVSYFARTPWRKNEGMNTRHVTIRRRWKEKHARPDEFAAVLVLWVHTRERGREKKRCVCYCFSVWEEVKEKREEGQIDDIKRKWRTKNKVLLVFLCFSRVRHHQINKETRKIIRWENISELSDEEIFQSPPRLQLGSAFNTLHFAQNST